MKPNRGSPEPWGVAPPLWEADPQAPHVVGGVMAEGYAVDDDLESARPLRPKPGWDDPIMAEEEASWTFLGAKYTGDPALMRKHLFLQRVYGILALQLLVTAGLCGLAMYTGSLRVWCIRNATGISIGTFVGALACLFGMGCYKHVYPTNVILLGGFTVLMGGQLGVVCAMFAEAGAGELVLQALIMTMSAFVGLTLFAVTSKRDFTVYTGMLGSVLSIMIVFSFISVLFGYQPGLWYSALGALVFCGFIVVDTQKIMDRMGPEDYVMASVELYLDIINLFLYILRILDDLRRR